MIYITQPTYLPWVGFFSFILKSKKVIFLDDVQFIRGRWQQRNKIFKENSFQYLTVPVKKKNLYKQKLNEVEVINSSFFKEHLKIIRHTYSKTKYFDQIFGELENLESVISKTKRLSKINLILIRKILDLINIETEIYVSSDLNTVGKKSEKLLNICIKINSRELLNNEGSKEYMLKDIDLFKKNNVTLTFFKYNSIHYNQNKKKFLPHLSIIDLLFNEGKNCKDILLGGLEKI